MFHTNLYLHRGICSEYPQPMLSKTSLSVLGYFVTLFVIIQAFVYQPEQVIFPPDDLGDSAVLWGIGLAATPSHNAVIIIGFNNDTTNVVAQVSKKNNETGLYEPYGVTMTGHPLPELHNYLQTDPAPAFMSADERIIIWGFNDVPSSSSFGISRFNSPPSLLGNAYGFLYKYYDNGTGFHYKGVLADPDSTNSRIWASDIHGTPYGDTIVVGAPVYPYTNMTPGAVVVFNLVSADTLTYEIVHIIERTDASLTLWGYNNVVSADGRYIVTGAFLDNRVYVYDSQSNYSEVIVFSNPDPSNDWFGYSVSVADDNYRIGIGAFRYNGGSFVGQIYTYEYDSITGNWSTSPITHDWSNKTGPNPGQGASGSFSRDGNYFAFGMPYAAGESHGEIGVLRYFPDNDTWVDFDAVTVFDVTVAPDEPVNIGWPSTVHTLISHDGCHLFGPGPGNIPIDSGYVFSYTDPECVPFPPETAPSQIPPPTTIPIPNITPPDGDFSFTPEVSTPQQIADGITTVSIMGVVMGVGALVIVGMLVYVRTILLM